MAGRGQGAPASADRRKAMRIAQIMLARGFGGGERLFVDLCRSLAARGHAVLAIGRSESEALDLLADGPLERLRVRCRGPWDPLCRRAIARALARFEPDIVQTHLARASALGGGAARAARIPTIANLHNRIDLKYYPAIDLLVPTTADQERYLRAAGVPPARIERIPNFSAVAPVAAVRKPRGAGGVVKALGRFVHGKGFDVLLAAAAAAAARGASFTVEIGGDGRERAALQALSERLGIAGRVAFPGWIDDVAAFLADADLFVLPSRDEAFGIVVLEAMARGVPIVATRVSGPLEVLDDESAVLVEPDDPDALAAAVRSALDDPQAAQARARQALATFLARYTDDIVVGRYLSAYRRLALGRRR